LIIPPDHPRTESLKTREKLIEQYAKGVVTIAGLIAYGRGEAFDYLLGEKTTSPALGAIQAGAAAMLLAEKPVISVNGNVAALVAEDLVKLSQATDAKIEVNLFYRSAARERAISRLLKRAGAREVLGIGEKASARIPELSSERRRVDPTGIYVADVVLVPLEDGDRTQALVKMGKKVIAVDLNPLSRTAQKASITIVDNIVRAAPKLIEAARKLKKKGKKQCKEIMANFDNQKNLNESITLINEELSRLAKKRKSITLGRERLEL
jgi:4-phosphopantoate--beta-alanine ligase